MSRKYISTTDTAKLIRKSLKEAFPTTKFSVVSSKYAGGSSIHIRWIDGPTDAEVSAISDRFAGAYFDGSIDYQGSVYAMMNGEQVHFCANFVFTKRENSDQAVTDAIKALTEKFPGNMRSNPTVEAFRCGRLWSELFFENGRTPHDSIQTFISREMAATSYAAPLPSKTAANIFVTHDDGYSRRSGSGQSVVAHI